MRFSERPARLAQEHRDPFGGLWSEPGDDLMQVETLEQLHDVVEAAAVVHPEIVELHGVRRAQAGGHLRFALEAPHELFLAPPRPRVVANEFDGRRASQKPVLAQPHLAHSPRAQGRHEPVAANREPFVQQLVVDLEQRAPAHEDGTLENRRAARERFPATRRLSSRRMDSGDTPSITLPSCRACRRTKTSTRTGMSSRRSASAGTAMLVPGEEAKQRTQAPALPFVGEVASGGGDHPHVGRRRLAAGARRLAILQLLMKLELERRRKLERRRQETTCHPKRAPACSTAGNPRVERATSNQPGADSGCAARGS